MADIFDEIENISQPSEKSNKVAKSFKFFGYEPKPKTIEPVRHQLMQKIVEPATELTTSSLGAPGDILSLLNEVIAKPLSEKITGKPSQSYEESLLGQFIPTSERLHKGIEEFAGEKIRPETTGEELLGTTAGFLGSMLGFGAKGLGKAGQIPFTTKKIPAVIKTVLNAFAPAAAFVSAKKADLPPWMQVGATLGTSLLMHRATNKNISQISKDLYAKSDELAKNVMMPSDGLNKRLDTLQEAMNKGLKTAPKSRINTLIDEIKAKSSGGAIPLSDLIQFRKDVIEVGKEFSKEQMKGSEVFWKPFRAALDNTINDYKNSEFQKTYRDANSLYRGIQESRKMETFIKKHFKESALGAAGGFLLKHLGMTLGIGPFKALAAAKTFNFINALRKNSGFRDAYKEVLKNATNENIKGTSRALKNFNQYYDKLGIDKEESKKDIFDELD